MFGKTIGMGFYSAIWCLTLHIQPYIYHYAGSVYYSDIALKLRPLPDWVLFETVWPQNVYSSCIPMAMTIVDFNLYVYDCVTKSTISISAWMCSECQVWSVGQLVHFCFKFDNVLLFVFTIEISCYVKIDNYSPWAMYYCWP